MAKITIIGAGLAGSEAAWQLAQRNIPVRLYEMRPHTMTPAHQTDHCGELVCSNSLRSDDHSNSAVGLLHQELRGLDSLIMRCADQHRVPAGGALAVDRHAFSAAITEALEQHPLIELIRQEIVTPPMEEDGYTIIASGPLTAGGLAHWIEAQVGKRMAFFDAIAPIVSHDSIDFSKAWKQSRYDKGDGNDYINCAMDEAQYHTFVQALLEGEKVAYKEFEANTPYFDGCLPIEVMAERGVETLRYGPMKPVGLTNPHKAEKSYAIVQLRQDNKLGTLWNMVGFQTKLSWPAQKRIFATIPGLEQAEFVRLGALHRNTFINSPTLLSETLQLKTQPRLLFAGQITGVEGYVESTACGLMAGRIVAHKMRGEAVSIPPQTTALGALMRHITGEADATHFQPMNVNFGLFPNFTERVPKKQRKEAYAQRALTHMQQWLQENS
ncbi:gid protein [Magnetococcus marinus MC-1]|uniref:Methylenetetrahydrofolate--tRNA-(uracil-5-)-methyltransferase TrmFO n=1 Tax=Magnetococcus marinus (strain ATCC BAA-1437 / JCM 17883 / MC-1) TaxID=156889 RepID=TRMFO_MAGMM|nr:methylenetetrahydrofolate--tRNA-(uracil(54)-C(5))-methyltransferase (FADH(2)-oxidizing) TrmFO [Magnetococcus marinus]A0LDC6.1 RecName: Full=Methylenetetrahydrofolate--tRNA-(uracil-5-)-methyltransferase TrmFO; AltName: Full=Folate-dependent tRNA (uracil-5-)-methyltransferase; AltName: Full=Folate-dependent tRNA(M-5-U54)-methyltransferase [Magnetococcus marinus MC-1]ABK45969.1 gid protein [Magnetococcus marinus MC-1]